MKHNETVILETGKYYRANTEEPATVSNTFLVVHQTIGEVSYRMYDPTDGWHSHEFTRKRHNFPCVRPYYNYAQQQIKDIEIQAESSFYRMKVQGYGESNWLNVTQEQMDKIIEALAD